MSKWTAANIPSQQGKITIVTGPTSGVGFYVALELVRAGAEVVLAGRSPQRLQESLEQIKREIPGAKLTALELNLANLKSVRGFAKNFADRYSRLDLLVNNAAVAAIPYQQTADGFEMQIGVNHFGHFALGGLLLPRLLAAPVPRLVTVASGRINSLQINFEDLQSKQRYQRYRAYMQSKLANLLFSQELQRRANTAGLDLKSVSAQPGWTATNLGPGQQASALERGLIKVTNRLFAHSPQKGALPILYAATMPDLPGGVYVCPDGFRNLHGWPAVTDPGRAAHDKESAARLWKVSEELTGVSYSLPIKAVSA